MNPSIPEPVDISDAVELEEEAYAAERAAEDATFDGDPPAAPEPEPEPEPEPAPEPATDASAEKASQEIERLGDRYTKAVQKVEARAQLGLVECPLCPVPGFVVDVPGLGAPPEIVDLVLELLGADAEPVMKPHPHLSTCEACGGLGILATGSRKAGSVDVNCEDCWGKGYVDDRQVAALAAVQTPALELVAPPGVPVSAAAAVVPHPGTVVQGGHSFFLIPGGSNDPYGRLPGHPLWGQDPSQGGL